MNIIGKIKSIVGESSISFTVIVFRLKDTGVLGKYMFNIYKFLLKCINLSVFPVIDTRNYKKITKSAEITIIENNRKGVTGKVIVVGKDDPVVLEEYPIPDLYSILYKDVCIRGNSDVVVDTMNNYVISDVSFNKDSNEEVIDGLLYRTRNNVCLLRNRLDNANERISSGIMMSGKFSKNYYHLMFETFIRILYLDSLDIPPEVPIVVDRKTMLIPSCKRVFELLTNHLNRNIVLIDDNKIIHFNSLYCISRVNIIPAHLKNPHLNNKILYSPSALMKMKDCLLKYKSNKQFSKRIFISRKSRGGRQFNQDEVFEVLKKYDFEFISPENYCFEDQMSIFNNAEFIVSGSGAALTNLLFVDKKCTIICFGLGSYDNSFEIPVFNTIANLNGAIFMFFPRENSLNKDIHVNYKIDCKDLENKIDYLIKKYE